MLNDIKQEIGWMTRKNRGNGLYILELSLHFTDLYSR